MLHKQIRCLRVSCRGLSFVNFQDERIRTRGCSLSKKKSASLGQDQKSGAKDTAVVARNRVLQVRFCSFSRETTRRDRKAQCGRRAVRWWEFLSQTKHTYDTSAFASRSCCSPFKQTACFSTAGNYVSQLGHLPFFGRKFAGNLSSFRLVVGTTLVR